MTTQPTALQMADHLESRGLLEEAAELRRLQMENLLLWKEREEPHKTIDLYVRECNRLESERDEARRTVREAHEAGSQVVAQRDALLAALRWIDKRCPQTFMDCPLHTIHREMAHDAGACARAAIKEAEGNT